MKNNDIKNKFIFSFSFCLISISLGNLFAFTQQRKPSIVEIQNARNTLRQRVQLVKSGSYSYYVTDRRSPKQIQTRNQLVNSWKQVEPELASFIGSWSGYESGWNIYPSNTKGKVCIIQRDEEAGSSVDIGTVIGNSIQTKKGKVFFKDGDYLGVGKIENNRFVQINDMPLSSPTVLKEPYLFKDINGFAPSDEVLKPYLDAGCTASVPSKNNSTQPQANPASIFQPILADMRRQSSPGLKMRLPSKLYLTNYEGKEIQVSPILENKSNEGINISLNSHPDCLNRACYLGSIFMGEKQGGYYEFLLSSRIFSADKLQRVRQAQKKYFYDRTNAENELVQEAEGAVLAKETITLAPEVSAYYVLRNGMGSSTPASSAVIWQQNGSFYSVSIRSSDENGGKWKKELIDIARSMASEPALNNIEQGNSKISRTNNIRVPDSFDLVFENNGMESKFVKGTDGYYTWYLTNYFIPGTCLGLKDNDNPEKVKLKMYGCNSKKKARKWEIVLANDNMGYKVKLPNTNLCLGKDKGVFDCNSSKAQVENLTNEQLRNWLVD